MEGDMRLFEILGPVMIGPSSSHTAGAARIGRTALKLLGEDVAKAEIGFCGSFASTYRGHGTDRAVVGGLMNFHTYDERLRDSLAIAAQRGMEVSFSVISLRNAHPNTVRLRLTGVTGKTIEVVGASIGGGMIEIRQIDGLNVSVTATRHTLIIVQKDEPGVIAHVSALLSGAGVNIATMNLSRSAAGGVAIMAMELDDLPSDEVVAVLRTLRGIRSVTMLKKLG